ncbi:hypothetical protein D3C71_1671540 [compost metagenome]
MLDHLGQVAFARGAQMGKHDESEPRLWGHAAEKAFQRFDAAGGSADTHNGKVRLYSHGLFGLINHVNSV